MVLWPHNGELLAPSPKLQWYGLISVSYDAYVLVCYSCGYNFILFNIVITLPNQYALINVPFWGV